MEAVGFDDDGPWSCSPSAFKSIFLRRGRGNGGPVSGMG